MSSKSSGRHYRFGTRLYTEDFRKIDIREFNQRGWLYNNGINTLTWCRKGEQIASVQFFVRTRVKFPQETPNIKNDVQGSKKH